MRWLVEHIWHDEDACLIWPFERTHWGYGTLLQNGQKRVASRVMCELVNGPPLGPEYEACHSCGHGAAGCVNPNHLRWGTRRENMQDAIAHGATRAASLKKTQLSLEQISDIRRLGGTMRQKDIGAIFGIEQYEVSKILSGARLARVI
jgi:hypothetical protein